MMTKTMARLVAALALAVAVSSVVTACGDTTSSTTHDMATTNGGGDMAMETCVMNPTTGEELLNGCTTAQTGDPAKDAPYFPSLAPGGQLPPLP